MNKLTPIVDALDRHGQVEDTFSQTDVEVLSYHFAIEKEIRSTLALLVERPDSLDRLEFVQLKDVLRAIAPASLPGDEVLFTGLKLFSDLRNAAAHPNQRAGLATIHAKLSSVLEQVTSGKDEVDGVKPIRRCAQILFFLIAMRRPIER